MRIVATFALLSGLAAGEQPAVVSGPTLGYVFDSVSRATVPLLGLPGAAVAAPPLAAGLELASAEPSPAGDLLLAVSAKDSSVLALRPGSPAEPVRGVAPGPDRIVFSPSGSHAALLYAASDTVQLLAGLPGHAAVRTLSTGLAGPLGAIAVSDAGLVLAAATGASGSTIWLLDARPRRSPHRPPRGPVWDGADDGDPQPVPVFSVGGTASLSFLPGSFSALVTDPAAHLLYRLADARRPGTATVLAGPAEGVADPTAIAVSPTGAYAAIAHPDGHILALDLRTGRTATAACGCHPTRVQPLALGAAFAIFADSRVLLFEAGAEPRFLFVPLSRGGAK